MFNNALIITADRLWIQRALPKPPRPVKRKRAAPARKPRPQPSSSKVDDTSDSELDRPVAPTKRSRTSGARATRSQGKEVDLTPSRSARAAKLRANKKLDAQAKVVLLLVRCQDHEARGDFCHRHAR